MPDSSFFQAGGLQDWKTNKFCCFLPIADLFLSMINPVLEGRSQGLVSTLGSGIGIWIIKTFNEIALQDKLETDLM